MKRKKSTSPIRHSLSGPIISLSFSLFHTHTHTHSFKGNQLFLLPRTTDVAVRKHHCYLGLGWPSSPSSSPSHSSLILFSPCLPPDTHYIHIYIYTYIHTYIHTYTHTHTGLLCCSQLTSLSVEQQRARETQAKKKKWKKRKKAKFSKAKPKLKLKSKPS